MSQDGGYHVSLLHGDLAAGLDLSTYETQVFDGYTTQTCSAKAASGRVSGQAVYAYVHPNLMINRYGPWLDTNVVYPIDEKRCVCVGVAVTALGRDVGVSLTMALA